MAVKPYSANSDSKKEQVEQMFDRIAFRYDLLNRVLSFGIDKSWRKKALKKLKSLKPTSILDVATGTGDVAILEASTFPDAKITGLDLSRKMLDLAEKKVIQKNLNHRIHLIKGDSEALPFDEGIFDAVTVAFGVRNFENLEAGLKEMNRVLRPGGKTVILEFSMPEKFPVKQFYYFYFKNILPTLGGWLSGDSKAYSYLPDSVAAFPSGDNFLTILKNAGFKETKADKLMFGIASIYTGTK